MLLKARNLYKIFPSSAIKTVTKIWTTRNKSTIIFPSVLYCEILLEHLSHKWIKSTCKIECQTLVETDVKQMPEEIVVTI